MPKRNLKGRAVAVVIRDGSVLLVESNHAPGHYVPPGGTLERREIAADCAAREVLEETGVRVRTGRLIALRQAFWPTGDILELYYAASVTADGAGNPDGGIEGRSARWVALDELPRVPHFPEELGLLCALAAPGASGFQELPALDLTREEG